MENLCRVLFKFEAYKKLQRIIKDEVPDLIGLALNTVNQRYKISME